MVTLIHYEPYSPDCQLTCDLDIDKLSDLYPDADISDLDKMLSEIESGEVAFSFIMYDAEDEGIELDWKRQRVLAG